MRVFLLHRDRDFELEPELMDSIFRAMVDAGANPFAVENARRNLERERARGTRREPSEPSSHDVLAQDLELETIWRAMAAGDEFVYETARRGLLSSLADPDAIVYRQQVLSDCLEHPGAVRRLYELALEGLAGERTVGSLWSGAKPDTILSRSVRALRFHVDVLRRLRRVAEEEAAGFHSEGFGRFFAMLMAELADEYLEIVEAHLEELEFGRGVLETASLGTGLKGRGYTVRRQREPTWSERVLRSRRSSGHSFDIHPRDVNGFRALEEIRGRGVNGVAGAVARSADHVKSFFTILRLELAFYLGCVNLHERLAAKGEPVCFPAPLAGGEVRLDAEGVYDVSLALRLPERVVANDVHADGKDLVVITGANQGGKSTLLRGLGVAQLMTQAGMFVGAESFRANVCTGLYSHFKREEDESMEGGKLDEELGRMSGIARRLTPGCLVLCNESFASTNEREGSEIAGQIVRALLDKGIKVFYVTHMYELARAFHAGNRETALFLRAERRPDGTRTFRLHEGEPLPTSYGEDSYRRIFPDRAAGEAAVGAR